MGREEAVDEGMEAPAKKAFDMRVTGGIMGRPGTADKTNVHLEGHEALGRDCDGGRGGVTTL